MMLNAIDAKMVLIRDVFDRNQMKKYYLFGQIQDVVKYSQRIRQMILKLQSEREREKKKMLLTVNQERYYSNYIKQ